MHGIKRFFSASPSRKTLDQEPEAMLKDAKSQSCIRSGLSASFDWFKLDADIKHIESLSLKWRSKSFCQIDKPLYGYTQERGHEYDNAANIKPHEGNEKHGSVGSPDPNFKSPSSSNIFEDALTPRSFEQSKHSLSDESIFVSPELYQFLKSSLPNIVKGCKWVLLYSTVRHGISFRTLIRKSAGLPGPCLLITGDMQGAVFGGLLDCPLKPTAKRKYQGTSQTFVFTTLYGKPRLFRATGANRYYYLCLNDLLALGGGSNFALCLNEDLLSGSSGPSETFGNSGLAHVQEFEIKNVELWGFTHSTQYLN